MSADDSLTGRANPIWCQRTVSAAGRNRSSFDPVAAYYPRLERLVFGQQLELIRRVHLDLVAQRQDVLIVGEGNGRFCAELLRKKVIGSITIVDSSARMLAATRVRLGHQPRAVELDLIKADARQWRPDRMFDCLVTQFFFDLFQPATQEAILARLTAACKPEAGWLNTDFTPNPTAAGVRFLHRLQYAFFRWSCKIEAAGLADVGACASARFWHLDRKTLGGRGLLEACWRVRNCPGQIAA